MLEVFKGRKRRKKVAQHECKVAALQRIKKTPRWQERGRDHCAERHKKKG